MHMLNKRHVSVLFKNTKDRKSEKCSKTVSVITVKLSG